MNETEFLKRKLKRCEKLRDTPDLLQSHKEDLKYVIYFNLFCIIYGCIFYEPMLILINYALILYSLWQYCQYKYGEKLNL